MFTLSIEPDHLPGAEVYEGSPWRGLLGLHRRRHSVSGKWSAFSNIRKLRLIPIACRAQIRSGRLSYPWLKSAQRHIHTYFLLTQPPLDVQMIKTLISAQAMDQRHSALVTVNIGANGFDNFRCDRNISMAVNLTKTSEILRWETIFLAEDNFFV